MFYKKLRTSVFNDILKVNIDVLKTLMVFTHLASVYRVTVAAACSPERSRNDA